MAVDPAPLAAAFSPRAMAPAPDASVVFPMANASVASLLAFTPMATPLVAAALAVPPMNAMEFCPTAVPAILTAPSPEAEPLSAIEESPLAFP